MVSSPINQVKWWWRDNNFVSVKFFRKSSVLFFNLDIVAKTIIISLLLSILVKL